MPPSAPHSPHPAPPTRSLSDDAPITRPAQGAVMSAAPLTAALVGGLFGSLDALQALARADITCPTALEFVAAAFFGAGLMTPIALTLGLSLAFVVEAFPADVGPGGAWRALRHLTTARGEAAARLAAGLWAASAGLGGAFVGLFLLNRTFMVTFHNQTLSSLLLSAVTLTALIPAAGVTAGLGRALGRGLTKLGERAPLLASPWWPVALVLGLSVAALVIAPTRYAEIWRALRLTPPLTGLAFVFALWLGQGLLARWLSAPAPSHGLAGQTRWKVALSCGLAGLAGIGALFGGTSASFSPARASIALAFETRGALVGVPLKQAQKWHDDDGDGYADRFGGADCDDTTADISPDADDVPDNGVDEDCDGRDFTLKVDSAALPDGALATREDSTGGLPGATGGEEAPGGSGAGSGTQAVLEAARKRYNIVWIMVDTLRWDHTGYSGYHRDTTPHTDKIAARSVVFENAYSLSSMTPMVIGPVMAGRWPSELPRAFKHFVEYDDEGNTMLAERLRDVGYLTAASAAHWYLVRDTGLAQGFMRWRSYRVSRLKMYEVPTSAQITDTALMMLDHLSAGRLPPKGDLDAEMPDAAPTIEGVAEDAQRPWFLYLHYLDPHANYIKHPEIEPFGKGYLDRYDGEVRFTDMHLRRLYEKLEKLDPGLDNTIVVFTSDHGEGFGHKDIWLHGTNLYEPLIRAAFFIHLPGAPSARIGERASLIDIVPTLLDAVGEPVPAELRGVSLLPTLLGQRPYPARPIYTEMPPGPQTSHRRSIIVGDHKIIHKIKGNSYLLYNLKDDPDEANNLWFKEPETARRMKDAYLRFRAQHVKAVKPRDVGR